MKSNILKAHLALLGANLIYGVNYIIAKGIMPNKIGPSAFVFIRVFFGGLLFWLFKSVFIKERVRKKDFPRLIICGFFGASTNQLFFFFGLNLTSPIDASIILTATPVIVLIFSTFLLKERITARKLLGLFVGAIGALILILNSSGAVGTSSLEGNIYVFLNAATYGLYLVLVKPLLKRYNAITVVSWIFLFGFIFVLPFGIPDILSTNFEAFTTTTYLVVGFVVVFTTFFAYLFNVYSLNYVSPSVTSSYIYLQPAISFMMVSLYAYVLNQDQYANDISVIKILSCMLVICGVYLISKTPKKITI